MKRLLVLTFLSILSAGSVGCTCCGHHKQQTCAPQCVPAAQPCCGGAMGYSTPGIITTQPTMTVPQSFGPQVIPGPAAYVPAQ